MKKYICLDKYGHPVEEVKGRYIFNVLRKIIHTRKVKLFAAYKKKEEKIINQQLIWENVQRPMRGD